MRSGAAGSSMYVCICIKSIDWLVLVVGLVSDGSGVFFMLCIPHAPVPPPPSLPPPAEADNGQSADSAWKVRAGTDLNFGRTGAQLSLAVVIIPRAAV